jgi:hypothetical protein
VIPGEWTLDMVAYEIYWRDEEGKEHFIGIPPERRKSPERITKRSVINWGWKVIADSSDIKKIYFVKVEVSSSNLIYVLI